MSSNLFKLLENSNVGPKIYLKYYSKFVKSRRFTSYYIISTFKGNDKNLFAEENEFTKDNKIWNIDLLIVLPTTLATKIKLGM